MKRLALLLILPTMLAPGCMTPRGRGVGGSELETLQKLDERLEEAERVWREAIDDPWTEPELKRAYRRMQDVCRSCFRREGGFASVEEKELCERVQFPFEIYFNDLKVSANRLDEQLFAIDKAGTVAYEYARRPSRENLEKLKGIFDQVHRYFVGWPYTWTRYINKYKFQRSRLERFRAEFAERDREYLSLKETRGAHHHRLELARRRAEFAFNRLKEECVTNDLPFAGQVNAFYRARNLDEYHRLREGEKEIERERRSEGRRKEVVVFVHGLSETRGSWGRFPELLSREDRADRGMSPVYFKVYVFSYDTVEDSKSIEGFKRELAGFISDIIRDEKVEKIHLVGHSFGAVLALKYMIHETDELLKGVDMTDPGEVADSLVKAYRDGTFRQTVGSFISIAGSLSGSEAANIAGDQFIPKERLFRRSLPLFRKGVPGYGDIQVRENQIGSEVNLNSFRRLDIQCPLDPAGLLKFLPEDREKDLAQLRRMLEAARVPALCVIGDPVKFQTLLHKEGVLKLGEAWRILFLEGLGTVLSSFRREEDDGLVKSYSANLNHGYLLSDGTDIGYRGAETRYTAFGHFSACRIDSRAHPVYRYVVSFLSGSLLPQIDRNLYRIRRFATLLRVIPDGVDPERRREAFFMPEERIVYLADRKLVLPPVSVEFLSAGGEREGAGAPVVTLGRPDWNWRTGARFCEGEIRGEAKSVRLTYRIRASGYREREVSVPIRAGEVTYASDIMLKKEKE